MQVDKMMTKKIVTVEMDDSLNVVKEIFDNVTFHHLLVIESGKLTGIISDRDLFKAISPNLGTVAETTKDLANLNKKAHQIMSRQPITLTEDASVYTAIDIFNEKGISCIPIVDAENKPLGILSWRDILRTLADNRKRKG